MGHMKKLIVVCSALLLITGNTMAASVVSAPSPPTGCDPVIVQFNPAPGPLSSASPVYIHIGRNGWQDVAIPDHKMAWDGTNWSYTYYPQPGTKSIDCVFNDGGGTWDNNSGADWEISIVNCNLPDHVSISSCSPVLTAPAGTNQNSVGESFGIPHVEGYLETVRQGGFGSLGNVMLGADANHLYIGGRGMNIDGDGNFGIIFMDVNTLTDDLLNLWGVNGLPNGLDRLHNIQFESPMDIAILIGSEFGDGTYSNFNLPNGINVGQGLFYLGGSTFAPVNGALLAQFDSPTTTSADDDGNDRTDHWMAAIPWNSLNADGMDDVALIKLCGVISSSAESGNDRYLSSNFMGTYLRSPYGTDTNLNIGFNFMELKPATIIPQSRIHGEDIVASGLDSGTNYSCSFESPIGAHHRIYKGNHPDHVAFYGSITSAPPSQWFKDYKTGDGVAIYAAGTHADLVDMKLMSFNIRYGSANDGTNSWISRRDQVFALLKREDPEIIGIQEAERFQLDEIHADVTGYGEVGEARNGGTSGEYSCIFYKTDLFTVMSNRTFWLSDTPDVVGSTSWGNTLPRICTWAKLQHKLTGRILYVFNTHLDHASQNSREQSIKLIVDRMANRDDTNRPFALTGDLNAGEANFVVQYLRDLQALGGTTAQQDGADMFDVFRVRHSSAGNAGTIHGFTGSTTGDKIDYIFLSTGVNHYDARILHDNINGRYPSDHFPITSRFLLEW